MQWYPRRAQARNPIHQLCQDDTSSTTDDDGTHGRVVEDGSDVGILDLVVRVERLDSVRVQLVEYETDPRSSRELVERQVSRVTVDRRPEVGAELSDDGEDDVALWRVSVEIISRDGFRAYRVGLAVSSSEGCELALELEEVLTDLRLDVRERRLDVVHENLSSPFISTCTSSQQSCSTHDIESLGEVRRSTVRRLTPVTRVVLEELLLVLERLRDGTLVVDIALSSVDDGDVSETEGDDTTSKNVDDVGSLVPASTASSVELRRREEEGTNIKSTLVKTPIVRVPSGSQSLAILSPSELARSVLAAVTARMIELGFMMNLRSISRI
jgi:hypothetical protein